MSNTYMTFQLNLHSLGWNSISCVHKNKENKALLNNRFTILSGGFFDKIALGVLRCLGSVFKGLKPVRLKFGAKYQGLPQDIYVTSHTLKKFLHKEAVFYNKKRGQGLKSEESRCWEKSIGKYCASRREFLVQEAREFAVYTTRGRQDRMVKDALESLMKQPTFHEKAPKELQQEPLDFYICQSTGAVSFDGEKPGFVKGGVFQITDEPKVWVTPSKEVSHQDVYIAENLKNLLEGQFSNGDIQLNETLHKAHKQILTCEFNHWIERYRKQEWECQTQVFGTDDTGIRTHTGANRISLNEHSYIATQQPDKVDQETNRTFWKMLREENSPIIVKLNGAHRKIIPLGNDEVWDLGYWPEKDEEVLIDEQTTLRFKEEQELDHQVVIRTFVMKTADEEKEIRQICFSGWQDMNVPSAEDFNFLMQTVNETYQNLPAEEKGPLTVHCTAGQGRTGTFLAAHSSLGMENVDYGKIVRKIRKQRPKPMVEKSSQFLFLHQI